jgi:hypothetical protein
MNIYKFTSKAGKVRYGCGTYQEARVFAPKDKIEKLTSDFDGLYPVDKKEDVIILYNHVPMGING